MLAVGMCTGSARIALKPEKNNESELLLKREIPAHTCPSIARPWHTKPCSRPPLARTRRRLFASQPQHSSLITILLSLSLSFPSTDYSSLASGRWAHRVWRRDTSYARKGGERVSICKSGEKTSFRRRRWCGGGERPQRNFGKSSPLPFTEVNP